MTGLHSHTKTIATKTFQVSKVTQQADTQPHLLASFDIPSSATTFNNAQNKVCKYYLIYGDTSTGRTINIMAEDLPPSEVTLFP